VLIELVSLGVTAEVLYERISIENQHFCSNGVSLAQNFRYKGSFPTNHSSCRKTINVVSYGIKIWAQIYYVLSQCTRLTDKQTDGGMDRRTERPSQYRAPLHYMQSRGKNNKLIE